MSVATGIDPLRLDEIDRWHPGMLDALTEAHRGRDSQTELTRVLIEQMRLVWRQMVVNGSGGKVEDPGPLDLPRPGEPQKKKQSGGGIGALARALSGRR